MQSPQNYVQIEVHNRIMQNLRQRQLQYKTKIIELEKQKQYEANRANEFQLKFKEVLLNSGDEVGLIEQLSHKENENNQLRMEIFRLKKSIDNFNDAYSGTRDTAQLAQTNKQLIIQNQQMANTIEELKNAAISAIMAKDDQIEELNDKISKAQELAILYQNLLEREEILQKQIEKIRSQSEQEQRLLSQKLSRQREKYLQNLEKFQNSLQNEQNSKQALMEKTELLQTNLQNKEQIIFLYQNKLNELQATFRQQRHFFEQEKEKLAIEIDNLKDKHSLYEKEISNLEKVISEYSFKEKQSKILNQRLRDENSELQRKISIKKRKNNPKLKSSDIYSSFEGISQKSSFYSSFYKPSEQVKPSNLGEIEELQQNDVLDSFIDLQQRREDNTEQNQPNQSNEQGAQSEEIPSKDTSMSNTKTSAPSKAPSQSPQSLPEISIPSVSSVELEAVKSALLSSQTEVKSLKERNETLKKNLEQSYTQIERLNNEIRAKTNEIQNERNQLAQLRAQHKKSQTEKQLMFELQNYKQHVYKLENALLIEKLQNAEKEEFMKERNDRQRRGYEEKISKMDEEIKNLSPKKKKGFFR